MKDDLDKFKKKYEDKIHKQFQNKLDADDFKSDGTLSSEYIQFKRDNQFATLNYYEQACLQAEKILNIKPDATQSAKLQEEIETCHMQMTPAGVVSFAILAPLILAIIVAPIMYLLTGNLLVVLFSFILLLALVFPLQQLPSYFAQSWRMRAGNQMILSTFYIVTYMRHTSNLERAIEFASLHLAPPMALDLRKLLWDVETNKYDTIVQSIDAYLLKWKDYNPEFVTSMHIIAGSLYETSEEKRQELLDKSLDLILEETYDKMLHYAHNLQSPITALHMLGIVLPILGLIILPLMVNFLPNFNWIYILLFYNIVLPIVIYVMSKSILSTRPSGYGGVEVDSKNPELIRRSIFSLDIGGQHIILNPLAVLLFFSIVGLLIGFSPLILHAVGFPDIGFGGEVGANASPCGKEHCLLGYKETESGEIGPFGLGATLLSLFIPMGLALALGLFFFVQSKNVIEFRNETQKLESEFTGALFQLGNRLGDGLPPEVAIGRVSQGMQNTRSGAFFQIISSNIQKLGMSVNDAIFNPKIGAVVFYPSTLIMSSMKILTQSAQKGPKVASNAIENVARYIKEMNRVNERLQDLMAEVISSMKSQINFLTPIIAGIVIGITSMITSILSSLQSKLGDLGSENSAAAAGANVSFLELFGDGVPSYYFQIIIGVYVVQVIYLLTVLINNIQNGVDPINEKYLLAINLLKGTGLYVAIAFIVILTFNILAAVILNGIN